MSSSLSSLMVYVIRFVGHVRVQKTMRTRTYFNTD